MATLTDALSLLRCLWVDPGDTLGWRAYADALEDEGRTGEATLVRLRTLLMVPNLAGRKLLEAEMRRLLYEERVSPPIIEQTNTTGIRLSLIPQGTFLMGSPDDEPDCSDDEVPRRLVTISRPFWIGVYPVTRKQWREVVGSDPSRFQDGSEDCPVEQVSWNDAVAFCQRLSEREPGSVYRLPTEAEWEYACRAGTTTATHYGDSLTSQQANFNGNYPYGTDAIGPSVGRTTPVGSYLPNAWGLYDMHGNVWEWCLDVYDHDAYAKLPSVDPVNLPPGEVNASAGTFPASDPGRVVVQRRLDLPNDTPRPPQSGIRLRNSGLPSGEGGEPVEGEPFPEQGEPGRRLVQLRAELPVGVPLQERADESGQRFGVPSGEGGEPVAGETFPAGDPGRIVLQRRLDLPNDAPLPRQPSIRLGNSGLPDSEGGESVEGDPFPGDPGWELGQLRHELPVGGSRQARADVLARRGELQGGEGVERVIRGGSWDSIGTVCQSASRIGYKRWYDSLGFRVVKEVGSG